jgi:formylglycine-generating enzyme required for sulfatase activity
MIYSMSGREPIHSSLRKLARCERATQTSTVWTFVFALFLVFALSNGAFATQPKGGGASAKPKPAAAKPAETKPVPKLSTEEKIANFVSGLVTIYTPNKVKVDPRAYNVLVKNSAAFFAQNRKVNSLQSISQAVGGSDLAKAIYKYYSTVVMNKNCVKVIDVKEVDISDGLTLTVVYGSHGYLDRIAPKTIKENGRWVFIRGSETWVPFDYVEILYLGSVEDVKVGTDDVMYFGVPVGESTLDLVSVDGQEFSVSTRVIVAGNLFTERQKAAWEKEEAKRLEAEKEAIKENTIVRIAGKGDLARVKALIEKNADVNKIVDGDTALIRAVRAENEEMARLLIEAGSNPNLTEETKINDEGKPIYCRSPLMYAVKSNDPEKSGKIDIVKLLLERKANPNYQDTNSGHTAIYLACKQWNTATGDEKERQFEIISLLIEAGAKMQSSELKIFKESRDYKLVKLFQAAGAEERDLPWLVFNNLGDRVIAQLKVIAEKVQSDKWYARLIDEACEDEYAPSELKGRNAIEVAAAQGNVEMIKALLNAKANPDPGVRWAAQNANVLKLLLKAGGTPCKSTLMEVVARGSVDSIESLIQAGLDPNFRAEKPKKSPKYDDEDWSSPLQFALEVGNTEVVKCLVKNGAQLYFEGEDIRKMARKTGKQEIAAFLEGASDIYPEPQTKVNPIDGAIMIRIPGGGFLSGNADDMKSAKNETTYGDINAAIKKGEWIALPEYFIYKNEVTVAQYRKFCEATDKKMPKTPKWGWNDDFPIVNVTFEDATAYAKWAGVALPSGAQWEKAARGTDARVYPWGNQWDAGKVHCSKGTLCDAGKPTSIGSFKVGASPFGALDMAGNVYEYTLDRITSKEKKRHEFGYDEVVEEPGHAVRGGSWIDNNAESFTIPLRLVVKDGIMFDTVGFRCVVEVQKLEDAATENVTIHPLIPIK